MSGPVRASRISAPLRPAEDATEAGISALEPDVLRRVLAAVSRGPGLAELLPAIVDLLGGVAGGHPCFVALRDGDRLTVRGAAGAFAHAVDRVALGLDDGLCGWVARHGRPGRLGDDGQAGARTTGAPGLRDERFRSALVVPLHGREGAVVGVLALYAEPARAFDDDRVALLRTVASLAAGPIENARLYDVELQRVDVLGRLSALVGRLARIADRAELPSAACDGTLALLAADRCRLHLVDLDDGAIRVVARAVGAAGGLRADDPPVDAPERGALAVRIAAGDAGEGILSVERDAPFHAHERAMLDAVAAQVAVGLRTVALVERLTEENLVRDLFDAIEDGRGEQVAARARSARIDPDRPHVVAVFEPLRRGTAWGAAERIESRLRHAVPGVLCDPGPDRLRVLLPVGRGRERAGSLLVLDEELDRVAREEGAVAGRSSVQPRLAAVPASLVEAASAARIARALVPGGGARAWEALGAYRYLVGMGGELHPDARHARAVAALWAYDARRGSELVRTLERYLADRSVVPTARALSIHPNTLRQRLERIEHLTDLAVAEEDLVSLELAIKLHRLRVPEQDAA